RGRDARRTRRRGPHRRRRRRAAGRRQRCERAGRRADEGGRGMTASELLLDTTDLVCPLTGQALHAVPIEAAEAELCKGEPLAARVNPEPRPVGRTPTVLVRDDGTCAYPVLDGIPILL